MFGNDTFLPDLVGKHQTHREGSDIFFLTSSSEKRKRQGISVSLNKPSTYIITT